MKETIYIERSTNSVTLRDAKRDSLVMYEVKPVNVSSESIDYGIFQGNKRVALNDDFGCAMKDAYLLAVEYKEEKHPDACLTIRNVDDSLPKRPSRLDLFHRVNSSPEPVTDIFVGFFGFYRGPDAPETD